MIFKRFRKTANLFDYLTMTGDNTGYLDENGTVVTQSGGWKYTDYIPCNDDIFTINPIGGIRPAICLYDAEKNFIVGKAYDTGAAATKTSVTIQASQTAKFIRFSYNIMPTSYDDLAAIMLNVGSQQLPYEPYGNTWHDTPHYIHNTSTDTITTPAVIYANDNNATVGLKGNMSQTGTPSPTTPIQPSECGDLETSGAKAGQYKIPILSNSATTPVYLGEVPTTRQIKKLVLTGQETWNANSSDNTKFFFTTISNESMLNNEIICTHFENVDIGRTTTDVGIAFAGTTQLRVRPENVGGTIADTFKVWLAQQYAAGTPVTVWYVLAEPTTGIVNEPLRKIGDYADEVSGISIPTIEGANAVDVLTTLKPSEVSVNYHGWHPVQSVHERENGAWT